MIASAAMNSSTGHGSTASRGDLFSYVNPIGDDTDDEEELPSQKPRRQQLGHTGTHRTFEDAAVIFDEEPQEKGGILKQMGNRARNAAAIGVNHLEATLNVDLDRDGDIGIVNLGGSSGAVNVGLQRVDDVITVTVHRAKDLKSMSSLEQNDVFVAVTMGDVTQLTTTLEDGGSHPEWGDGKGECLVFSVADSFSPAVSAADENFSTSGHKVIDVGKYTPQMRITVFDRIVHESSEADSHLVDVSLVKLHRTHNCIGDFGLAKDKLLRDDKDFETKSVWFPLKPAESSDSEGFKTEDLFAQLEELSASALNRFPLIQRVMGFTMDPASKGRRLWDPFILFLVFYSSLVTPYKVAFNPGYTLNDMVVDCFFVADIVATFFTGFDRGFEVIMDKKQICINYLSGWFAIDLIATVPWEKVLGLFHDDIPSTYTGMLRLIKVTRLFRAGRIVSRVTNSWTVHSKFIEAFNFFLYVLVVVNLLACLFYLWPTLTACPINKVQADEVFANMDINSDKSLLAQGWHWRTEPEDPTSGDDNLYVEGDDKLWKGMVGFRAQSGTVRSIDMFPKTTRDLRICQETEEFGLELGKEYTWTGRTGFDFSTTGYNSTFRAAKCPRCLTPWKAYLDALYWSLTTITTIGYGDRAPTGTGSEITFVLVAEFVGLGFFAILLTQINTINDVVGESERRLADQKNDVVQFLKYHELDAKVVTESVRFLNFRHSSLAGNCFRDDDERFAVLSPGIRSKIKVQMNRPVLKGARLFGWDPKDVEEAKSVRLVFDSIDTLNNGRLTKPEVQQMFKLLQLKITDEEFEVAFDELDVKNTGEIDFREFRHWWYMKKHGKPIMEPCPSLFLDMLAEHLQTQAFDINEVLVARGNYAMDNGRDNPSFGIVLQGSVFVWKRPRSKPPVFNVKTLHKEHDVAASAVFNIRQPQFVQDDDLFPVFGAKATLQPRYRRIVEKHGIKTTDWSVIAATYVDLAWIDLKDIWQCFKATWPEGQEEFLGFSFAHYCHGNDATLHEIMTHQEDDEEPLSDSSTVAADAFVNAEKEDHTAVLAALANTQRDVKELRNHVQSEIDRVMAEVRKANEVSQQVLVALQALGN